MDSGVLSQFIGVWSEDFYGGPRVRSLERAWAERFGARHAITMNSATSALNAAAAAAGVGPGDEVIVSPYTMSASAVCALVNGAIPVFADIEPDTFCLDPESVRERDHAAHEGDRRRRHLRLPGRLRADHGARRASTAWS